MADPKTSEFATIQSDPFVPQYLGTLQPSDDVIVAKGGSKGVALYDEIRRDPHAFAIVQKRKLEVVSREWNVVEASPRRIDKKAAEEVQRQLRNLDFDRLTRGLLGAVLKGFAVAEIVWTNVDGVWNAAVKVKKQRRFRFSIDGELRMLTRSNVSDGEPVPERKFIVHRHSIDDDDDDPYGIGLGNVLFWPAWFKRQALAHWLRANEKHASPTTKATYSGAFDSKRQDELAQALRRMANDTTIVVPEAVQLELLEATGGGGGDLHEKLNRYLDELMSEAVLGETLSTNSGERGARSLGDIHNQVRIAIAKADADLVSATIKATLARWIVELNFPGAGVPDVWRDFSEAEDLNERILRDKAISEMGYRPKDVSYIDETYGGEWVETQPATAGPDPVVAVADDDSPTAGLEFADNPAAAERAAEGNATVDSLSEQLADAAAPSIDAMVAAIRREFDMAVSYADLSIRMSRLASEMGVDDLAGVMEQALVLARLEGHASAGAADG